MISWDGRTRKVVFDGRPVDAAGIVQTKEGWIATIAVARGVDLTLSASQEADEFVELGLWRRPARDEVGIAVVADRGKPAGLAVVPACGCGDRGCANVRRQTIGFIDAAGALEVIELVSRLPLYGRLQSNQEVWQPHGAHRAT